MRAAMLGKDHVTIGLSGGNLIRNSSRDASAWRQQAGVFHTRFESGLIASRGPSTSRIEDLSSWPKGRVAVAGRHVFRSVQMGDHPVVALLDFSRHPIYNLNCLVLLGNW